LTKEDKKKNRELASERVANENVIGMMKRFLAYLIPDVLTPSLNALS